jgi:hypothetical protein
VSRRVWLSVVVAAALLVASSVLRAPAEWADRGRRVERIVTPRLEGARRWLAARPTAAAGAGGAIAVLVLAGLGLLRGARARRRRAAGHEPPWREAIELAGRGRSVVEIARRTGLAQDAVRTVLTPREVERPLPRGRTFRHDPPGPRVETDEPRPRRRR